MRFVTEKEFNNWINDMVKSYHNRGKEFDNVRILTLDPAESNGRTIIMNLRTGKAVVAKCHKDDVYTPKIGLAVAWAKYRNMEIPIKASIVSIHDLEPGDEFYFRHNFSKSHIFLGFHSNGIEGDDVILYKDNRKSKKIEIEPLSQFKEPLTVYKLI